MMYQNPTKEAAEAMSSLYVWDCVVSILESGAAPRTANGSEEKDVQRVIKIANKAKSRLLDKYDRAAARAKERT